MAKTLDKIMELYRAYRKAQGEHTQAYREQPEPLDYNNEDHIRAKINADRICARVVKAGNAYREACDEFFAKGCADLIQLLVDVDEHFDGQEDADDGIPNTAMRCRQQIEAFLGPAPAKKPEAERNLAFSGSF